MNPSIIPDHQKKSFLKSMTEDDFRDKVVRPLLLAKGMRRGKDTHGVDEEGKDCYLYSSDSVRDDILYAIQTKKGDIKMSRSASENLIVVMTQLRTARDTPVHDAKKMRSVYPDRVMLVVSGEINKAAQQHIVQELKDERIMFMDSDDLIGDIDKKMPEFWLGIDAQRLPYLKNYRQFVITQSDTIDITQLGVHAAAPSPITDESYVQLYLNRQVIAQGGSRTAQKGSIDFEEFTVQQLMSKPYRRVLVSGDAGSGKTTALRRLALLMMDASLQAASNRTLPVLLRAVDIARSSGRLVDDAADFTTRFTGEQQSAFSRDDLIAGNVTILIDGYDELSTPELRQNFLSKLKDFDKDFVTCRIVLTSRDTPYLELLQQACDFIRLSISPINIGQAGRIIDRLSKGKNLPTHTTQEILRRLDTVHGIDLSPLLVTVFVATTDYARSDIPANITELFKKFTEMMLGRWDQNKGLAQQYHSNLKDFLLTRVAFEMHERGDTTISVEEFHRVIADVLKQRGLSAETETLYDEIVHRSGLIRVDGEELAFRHLLLQEFFAGRGIPSAEFLRSVLGNVWWQRAIVFYFGERPGDEHSLSALPIELAEMGGTDLYQAAISVGLALQACYLTKTNVKLEVMEWVIHSMASSYDDVCKWFLGRNEHSEVMPVVFYYMLGRDSAGAKVIGELAERMFKDHEKIPAEELTPYQERLLFWCLVGLISVGDAKSVKRFVRSFSPNDTRLLLAVQIGCAYLARVQVVDAEEKKIAREVSDTIRPIIKDLSKALIKEMKGYLLEVQKGDIRAVDNGRDPSDLENEFVEGLDGENPSSPEPE